MKNIEKDAKSLLATAAKSPNMKELQAILDAHAECFESDLCEICEYLEDELFEDLLDTMASNKSLTATLQDQILEAAQLWQGKVYNITLTLAANPCISDAIKSFSLDPAFWYGSGEGEDIVNNFLNLANKNKRYLKSEIEEFVEDCTAEYGFEE